MEKYHFEHPTITGKFVKKDFEERILPWCKKNKLKLLIMDNDAKCHSKMITEFMNRNGVQIYWVSGENVWIIKISYSKWAFEDKDDSGFPPWPHDWQPEETEFANAYEDAQLDLERREKNLKKKRTMLMWHNAIEHTWETRPIVEVQKLIDRQPMVMKAIIEAEGGQTPYWDL